SADGISAAAVRFDGGSAGLPKATLLAYHERPYVAAQRDRLLRALDGASHGNTIWHEAPLATWQIGQSAVIAERTGVDVISDFRVRDVAAGGQGAPLVPIADSMLFAHPTLWRALQNLGGIGNVTVVPPGGVASSVRAFDTGPGVVVIDAVTRTVVPDQRFDAGGKLARSGTPIEEAVADALSH